MKKFSREEFFQLSGWSLAGSLMGVTGLASKFSGVGEEDGSNPLGVAGQQDPQGAQVQRRGSRNGNAPAAPLRGQPTIQEILDLLVNSVEGPPLKNTVDSVKTGEPGQVCTGVVTCFLATAEIIQKAADQGANLILTHEPTFYNHRDTVDWLEGDPVYEHKRELLEKHNIVVWRHHDYWHDHQPDGILHGFVREIGWEEKHKETRRNTGLCQIEETSLMDLAQEFKQTLDLKRPFVVGDPDMNVTKVGLLPGSWGARSQMRMLRDEDVEVLVIGEVAEWETSEYVRDAAFAGMNKGLIILAHAPSEGPGMQFLAEWLRPQLSDVEVSYEETPDAFVVV